MKLLLEQYGPALFEPKELVVLVHLSRRRSTTPCSWMCSRRRRSWSARRCWSSTASILGSRIAPATLVQQLGDQSPKARDSAETRLFEMGPVAVPVLEDALKEKDIEIVFRAERLLLKLNRQVP